MGMVSPLGRSTDETLAVVHNAFSVLKPLRLFPIIHSSPLPVGEVTSLPRTADLPRTHLLALSAAEEVMKNASCAPDAVVIGTTTGGIASTEELLKAGSDDALAFRNHSAGSVSECIARKTGCKGPVLTVSTACSLGSVALQLAMKLLRSGTAKQVLAGGVDSLCRLTYYGFNALQLIDPTGAHPFDVDRCGMSVAEGAALFLLTAAGEPPGNAVAELLGAGLSCDAYHPASPHPEGAGALLALQEALTDAGVDADEIGYIHYHGTGTLENDLAEAKAISALFSGRRVPLGSSTKGSYGHTLAASGAIGAALASACIHTGVVPVNTGLKEPDPALNFIPVSRPVMAWPQVALSNAFGFGGNNSVLVLGNPKRTAVRPASREPGRSEFFEVLASACLTGAGGKGRMLERMSRNETSGGLVPPEELTKHLSERYTRRMKRLSRLTLALAAEAGKADESARPCSIFFGTGWGGLSETYDFLSKLFASEEKFTSPIDFIGSVHNAPAGQASIYFGATGPNVTMTGGDCSFEQALMSAALIASDRGDPLLVIGADEHHSRLSPLFDGSVHTSIMAGSPPADGGGALLLRPPACSASSCRIRTAYLAYTGGGEPDIPELIRCLGGAKSIRYRFAVILVGIPAERGDSGRKELASFLGATDFSGPVIDYRRITGEFASASAVAAVLAVSFVQAGEIPSSGENRKPLQGRGALVLGFGNYLTAMEITK